MVTPVPALATTNGFVMFALEKETKKDVLFAPEEPRCDACGSAVHDDDSEGVDDADGGHGLYVWARGGETVYEEPPLCASCAAAITITALQRWEIEEEEG